MTVNRQANLWFTVAGPVEILLPYILCPCIGRPFFVNPLSPAKHTLQIFVGDHQKIPLPQPRRSQSHHHRRVDELSLPGLQRVHILEYYHFAKNIICPGYVPTEMPFSCSFVIAMASLLNSTIIIHQFSPINHSPQCPAIVTTIKWFMRAAAHWSPV